MPDPSSSDTSLNLNPKAKDQALAPHEVDLFQRALAAPLQSIPKEFETWLVDRIAVLLPLIPIGQIVGFNNFTFQPGNYVATQESTGSGTYVDLATVGPSLSGLADGSYAVFFGAQVLASGQIGSMSVSINGAAATDDDSAVADTAFGSTMRLLLKDLTNDGNNSLVCKYRSASGTPSFLRRWMVAVKYANL